MAEPYRAKVGLNQEELEVLLRLLESPGLLDDVRKKHVATLDKRLTTALQLIEHRNEADRLENILEGEIG